MRAGGHSPIEMIWKHIEWKRRWPSKLALLGCLALCGCSAYRAARVVDLREVPAAQTVQRTGERTSEPLFVDTTGALVAKRWGLPRPAVNAIGRHHSAVGDEREDAFVALIAVANRLARLNPGRRVRSMKHGIPPKLLDRIGIEEHEVDDMIEQSIPWRDDPIV